MPAQNKKENNKKFRSLTTSLTLVFFGLTFVIVVTITILSVYFNVLSQQELIAEQQEYIAYDAAITVKSFIQEKFSILEATNSLNDLVSIEKEESRLILEKILGLNPSFRQLTLIDKEKKEILNVSRLSTLVSGGLIEQVEGDIFSFFNQEKKYISSVYIDDTTSEPQIIIAIPVKNIFGDFNGNLMAEVNLKFMWNLVNKINIGRGGLAYVVDRSGSLLAFNDISRVLKGEKLLYLDEVREFVSGNELIRKKVGKISDGIEGTRVVANHIRLISPDWAVVVELPISEVYNSMIRQIVLLVLVILMIFGLGVLAVISFSRRITKPVIELRNTALEIGKGNLDIEIKSENNNEIGELAKAFNKMAVDLKESRKELENYAKSLKEESARLIASINSLSIGFIIFDSELKIFLLNNILKNILGLNNNPSNFNDIESQFQKIPFDLRFQCEKCLKEKKPIEIKELVFGKKFLKLFLAPIVLFYEVSETIGIVMLIEDVTEAKALERSKEDFFAMASHELRTPLTAIRGNASIIKDFYADKIKDEEILKMVDDMHKASIRLIHIVNDFLNASSLEQNKIAFKIERFNMADLVKETLKEFEQIAKDKGLYLKTETFDDSFNNEVKADKEKTRQVIINFLGNAIRFTRKGGVTISIKKQGDFLKISVKDTGMGISLESQPLLFKKFQVAVENTLTHDLSSGSGLGLYISKLLIETMGGKIGLEKSVLGEGSVFFFVLPLAGIDDNNKKNI
ncbi:HAMP domain-containing protein [Candidatus Wolfebacteria bacterium]|nr:HAMP domain-containing protein [Candidatus Wolfebacteria bacterium]